MVLNFSLRAIYFFLFVLISVESKSLSINEISWSEYIGTLKDSTIDSNSYKMFKDATIKITDHNKDSQTKWGVTPFLHVSTDDFSKRFARSNELVLSEYNYKVEVAAKIFSQLPSNKYFSWADKEVLTTATDDLIAWPNVVSSFVEIYYKIRSDLRFSVDTINIQSCYSGIYDALNSITKSNTLLSDYQRRNSDCIPMIIHNLRERGYDYQEIRKIEAMSLPSFQEITSSIDIYSSPMIVEISVDSIENLQYYDNSILTLDSDEKSPNYSAIIIGYGKDGEVPYWIVRANFGSSWGFEGNFKLNPTSTGIKYIYQF